MLNRLPVILLFAAILVISSCKKANPDVEMDLPVSGFYFLAPDSNINVHRVVSTFDLPTQLDGAMAENNTSKSRIKEGKLTKLIMDLWADPNLESDSNKMDSFAYLNYIDVYLAADGITPRLAAFKKDIPLTQGDKLYFDLTHANVADFLIKDKIRLDIHYSLRRPVLEQSSFSIISQFWVKAAQKD